MHKSEWSTINGIRFINECGLFTEIGFNLSSQGRIGFDKGWYGLLTVDWGHKGWLGLCFACQQNITENRFYPPSKEMRVDEMDVLVFFVHFVALT